MIRRSWPQALPAAFLSVLCLGLLLLAGRSPAPERSAPGDSAAPHPAEEPPPTVAVDYRPPSEPRFDLVVARNLFSIARAAPREAAHEQGSAAGAQDFTLVGVLLAEGEAIALLRDRPGNRTVQATVGGTYGGWELVRLDAGRAVLRRGGETMTLDLLFAAPSGAPAVGVPPGGRRRLPLEPRRGDAQGNPVPAARPSLFEIQRGEPANAKGGDGSSGGERDL